jgi:hypothetical protein
MPEFSELRVFDKRLGTYVPKEMYDKAQATADRQKDVIWKLEKQIDEIGEMSNRRGELVDVVNRYRKSRLITDRKAMFELAKELEKEK